MAALAVVGATAGPLVTLGRAAGQPKRSQHIDHITIQYPPDIEDAQIEAFLMRVRDALEKVQHYLNRTYTGGVLIDIDRSHIIPVTHRGEGKIGVHPNNFAGGDTGVVHELTHLVADSGSFWVFEGLAVHTNDLFSWERGFPNYRRPLHEVVARTPPAVLLSLAHLDSLRSVTQGLLQPQWQTAYAQCGSFVQYAIEALLEGDVRRFMLFHDEGKGQQVGGRPVMPYAKHFARELRELERGWIEMIRAQNRR